MSESDDFIIDFSEEELKNLSRLLADTYINAIQKEPELFSKLFENEENLYPVISEPIVLDLVASSMAGASDILGQIRDFITSSLNAIASWITSALSTWITQNVLPAISGLAGAVSSLIGDAVKTITNSASTLIASAVATLSTVISTLGTSISDFISTKVVPFLSVISDFLTKTLIPTLSGIFSSIASGIISVIQNSISSVVGAIRGLSDALVSAFSSFASAIGGVIRGVADGILSAISGVINVVKGVADTIVSAFKSVATSIGDAIKGVASGLLSAIQGLANALAPMFQSVISTISSAISTAVSPIQSIVGSILSGLQSLVSLISSGFNSIATAFMGFANALLNFPTWFPTWFNEHIAKPISDAIGKVASAIWNLMPDFVKDFLTKAKDFFDAIVKFLTDFLKDPIKAIQDDILKPTSDFISSIPFIKDQVIPFIKGLKEGFDEIVKDPNAWLTKHILQPIADFVNKTPLLRDYVVPFLKALAGFVVEFTKDPIKAINDYIFTPAKDFISNLPIVKDYIAPFVTKAIDEFKKFIANPIDYIKALAGNVWAIISELGGKLLGIFADALTSISNAIKNIAISLFGLMKNVATALFDQTMALGKALLDSVFTPIMSMFNSMISLVSTSAVGLISAGADAVNKIGTGIGEIITPIITSVTKPIAEGFGKDLEATLQPNIDKLRKGWAPQGEYNEIITGLTAPLIGVIGYSSLLRGTYLGFHAIANHLPNINVGVTIGWRLGHDGTAGVVFEPLGAGGRSAIRTMQRLGLAQPIRVGFNPRVLFRAIAGEIKTLPQEFSRSLLNNYGFWMMQPIAKYSQALLRNTIVIELPSLEMISEILRRKMELDTKTLAPAGDFAKFLEDTIGYLRLYGYNDDVINWLTKTDDKIVVTDRFGNPRQIPLALMFNLPSPSDIAEMYVKDLFKTADDFFKFFRARGMFDDVGKLYYYLRFKYPPPERLWQFIMRGVSGLLWASISKDAKDDIDEEIKAVGGYPPVSAVDLNFNASVLFDALQKYMKWYDYFRPSWIEKFTSDNQIMIDTLAEIPTRIDQRWMVRFGLYQFLSSKNITRSSAVSKFRTDILEDSAKSNIQIDLQNFCRTLQATGIHPDYVPLTAVAETIVSVGDERNLVRSGALNLFKEGFWNYEALSSLFNGALTVSFQVSAFDTSTLSWTDGKWVNVPLIFLPAEASLIQLKASMDRVLDILRELQRTVSDAYADNILEKYDDFKATLTETINTLNDVFATDYKNIVGTALPDSMKLTYVEAYFKPLSKVLEVTRSIYITRRIRSWTQRWIGWIMYRLATGVTKPEDFKRLLDSVKGYAKLTDTEYNFISGVMELMGKIASREYIPAPSQLATMSELVVIPDALIDKVLEARLVPDEWKPIWKNYIKVRPLADDIKGVLTAYRRALVYNVVPSGLEAKVTQYASMINFTAQEMEILRTRVELEEAIANSREYIPSIQTLASLVEYIPEARNYFDAVVKAKHIPKDWIPLWQKYIDVRPLVDDVKRYLSRAEELYVRFMTKKDAFLKVLDEVNDYLGYTDKELDFLEKVTEYERFRNAWTELVGTVDRLVSLSEYSPTASNFALGKLNEMIDALPIDDATKNSLKKMWQEYIKNRPVRSAVTSYITALLNAYASETISFDFLQNELNSLKDWGITDNEIKFYISKAQILLAKKLKIQIG